MPEVKRERRPRRRRDEEDDEDGGGFGGWKLGLVIGVIVVCFAVVYPHVFHPLLMSLMGRSSDPVPQAGTSNRPPMHPGMAGRGPAGSRGPAGGPEHPSMRMASMQAEAAGKGGGARSMYTFMIPIYTVGVIAFLLYTMFKSKKKNRRNRRRGSDDEYSDDEEDEGRGTGRGRPLGGRKMRDLQDRLKQTESAMSKILEQLEKAQSEGKLTPEMMANLGNEGKKLEKEQPKPVSSKGKKTAKKDTAKVEKTPEKVAPKLPDEQTTQYMEDLEKALADFKELSDLYEDAQGGKRRRQASESEESEEASGSEEISSEDDADEEEQEDGDSKASGSHPFPEENGEIEEIEDDEKETVEDKEEQSEEEEEVIPEPQPAPKEKVRRRKPNKI